MIPPDIIEKIMDAARIEEVVGEFVTLKKRGVNMLGLCPFHNEKTPSFNVSPVKGIYKCFGCGKGGNVVTFLMEHEHYTYPEALRYLAGKYNIEVEEEKPTPEQQQEMDEKESLFALNAFARKYFEDKLHNDEEGKSVALSYLRERGFTTEVIRKFGLGYCPGRWDEFSQTATKSGYSKEYLEKSSLSKSKDHMLYDTFRGRIVFPIHNLSGRVLGFGARIMRSDTKRPKYINSAESAIYHKSKVLYGIYFARSAMAARDNCYLVEGYTDVLAMHQSGIENVIATSGTALSTDQLKLVRRYTTNVTLLFDGDPAGIKAAFRGIDMILEEGLNVRIVLFPDGEDPDSFARKHRPAEVQEFVEKQAKDFISLKTELLLDETGNDPLKKAQLIKEIAQSIARIPEPITRSLYIQQCSELMAVDEKLMVSEINSLRRKKRQAREQSPPAPRPGPAAETAAGQRQQMVDAHNNNDSQEKELVRLLLHYAGEDLRFEVEGENKRVENVTVKVGEFIIQDILEEKLEFDNGACQAVFNAYAQRWKSNELPGHHFFTEHPDKQVQQLAIDLLAAKYTLSKNWESRHRIYVIDETENLKPRVLHALYAFKLKKLEQMISENHKRIREAGELAPPDEPLLLRLMEHNRDLLAKRSLFADALNRVITK